MMRHQERRWWETLSDQQEKGRPAQREVPVRVHFSPNLDLCRSMLPFGNIWGEAMAGDENTIDRRASSAAIAFGLLIRSRRKALGMRQDQLALATGVGRRFLIELEAGKPSCQLGRSLLVAQALGLSSVGFAPPCDGSFPHASTSPVAGLDLPELPEEVEAI
jgi:DNA-binding XRE family transcriptional regulator